MDANVVPTSTQTLCLHCASLVPPTMRGNFCCSGCSTVYALLKASGLSDYYEIRSRFENLQKPVEPLPEEIYAYLDEPDFCTKYVKSNLENEKTLEFYLEGIHCAACLWLIEKVPTIVPNVKSCTLDLSRSVAKVTLENLGSFSAVARIFDRLGYRPHPLLDKNQTEALRKKENRLWLIRIGIAAAGAGNIMLMTVPLYSGVEGNLAIFFRWFSAALFIPVVGFSGVPFYRSAITALQNKNISVDVPVFIAIIAGTLISFINLVRGSEEIYFDSVSSLIFLLLSTRYLLRRIQQGVMHYSPMLHFLTPPKALKVGSDGVSTESVSVNTLVTGDLVRVDRNESLPADGILRSNKSQINCALLTGESIPKTYHCGDEVFAATVNAGEPLLLEVLNIGETTRIGKILSQVESGSIGKASMISAADKLARYFLSFIFVVAICLLIFSPSFGQGLNRALSLLIVTCPCALALAMPLTMSLGLSNAARHGILIKNSEVLEKLSQIKNVILDKTGTLTYGQFELLDWEIIDNIDSSKKPLFSEVLALERFSKHPIAKAIQEYLGKGQFSELVVTEFKDVPGVGVSGVIGNNYFEVCAIRKTDENKIKQNQRSVERPSLNPRSTVGVYKDGILQEIIYLGDRLRPEAKAAVQALKNGNLGVYILSGDAEAPVLDCAKSLDLKISQCLAQASPEEKQEMISNLPNSLMVGDGANDALALSSAFVSAAVHGSMDVSLKAADVYLSSPGLAPILKLLALSKKTMRIIRLNLIFSVLYNSVGIVVAVTGQITPLFAALLMPLSAVTLFTFTVLGFRERRPS